MNTTLIPGYEIRYKLWSDFCVYKAKIDGAVKFKVRKEYNVSSWGEYIFYNKKKEIVFQTGKCEMMFIQRIYTIGLEEDSPISFITFIKSSLKIKP